MVDRCIAHQLLETAVSDANTIRILIATAASATDLAPPKEVLTISRSACKMIEEEISMTPKPSGPSSHTTADVRHYN